MLTRQTTEISHLQSLDIKRIKSEQKNFAEMQRSLKSQIEVKRKRIQRFIKTRNSFSATSKDLGTRSQSKRALSVRMK